MSATVLEAMPADRGTTVLWVTDGDDWVRVTDEVARIEERRMRNGMPVSALADLVGVDRTYLGQVLKGQKEASGTYLGKVAAALDRFEKEIGEDTPAREQSGDMVEFEVSGNLGVKVIVKGPVRDRAELEETVLRLVSRLQTNQSTTPEG